MKRITIIVEDNVTLGDLSSLINVAKDVRIETVNEEKPKEVKRRHATTGVGETIMGHFTPAGKFTSADADAWCEKGGHSPTSGSPGCSSLVKTGHLTRLGKGRFQFAKPLASSSSTAS